MSRAVERRRTTSLIGRSAFACVPAAKAQISEKMTGGIGVPSL